MSLVITSPSYGHPSILTSLEAPAVAKETESATTTTTTAAAETETETETPIANMETQAATTDKGGPATTAVHDGSEMQTPPLTPSKQGKKRARPSYRGEEGVASGTAAKAAGAGAGVGKDTDSVPITPKRPKTANKTSKKTPAAPSRLLDWNHLPSRRSSRVAINATKQTAEDVCKMMRNKQEPGIASVEMADMKGFGVVAQKRFAKGDYVCEYSGDLITMAEARAREQEYISEDAKNNVIEPMCYMYYLSCGGKKWCVDATKSGRIGRLINHSRNHPNLQTKLLVVDKLPRLGFYTLQDIEVGTELLYDYGERDPAAMAAHPWLKEC